MSNYRRRFPRSLPALYVRLKESRFRKHLAGDLVPGYTDALSPNRMERNIWLYWAQGWEDAPDVVKRCATSWQEHNPDWNVVLLNDENLADYIDCSNVPADINRTKQSNIWRLRLLERYGGLWSDATVLCTRPVSDWLSFVIAPTGCFVFKRPAVHRPFASWLMAAERDSYLVSRFRGVYEEYIRAYGDYHVFALHYVFEYLLRSDRKFSRQFAQMPSISANPSLAFGRWISEPDRWPRPDAQGVPVHKLSWKLPISQEDLDSFLNGRLAAVP